MSRHCPSAEEIAAGMPQVVREADGLAQESCSATPASDLIAKTGPEGSPCFCVRPALGLHEPLGVTGGLADLGGH
jgi:hypothetical protein